MIIDSVNVAVFSIKNRRYTFRSPDILAPANIPVAAGKNIANTEKKLCDVCGSCLSTR